MRPWLGVATAAIAIGFLGCSNSEPARPASAAPSSGATDTAAGPAATDAPGGTTAPSDDDAPRADAVDWTVLIYMDIDNNLEAQKMSTSLGGAAQVGSSASMNVIALVDRTSADTADPSAPDGDLGSIPQFDGSKLIRVDRGDFTELQDLGEVDMGDPQTLAWFVNHGVTQFPANHYSLIFANHGGAISGAMWDDASGSNLKIPDMAEGIESGLRGTGVDKFDLIGYDACLMATYDSALTLAPVADWLVASEEVSLTNTYDYAAALGAVVGNPEATGETMGRAFVDNSVSLGWPIGTTSLIDLSKMGLVQQAVDSLGRSLAAAMPEIANELGRQRAQTLEFGIDPNTGQNQGFSIIDLGDLARRLGDGFPDEVQVARSAVFDAITSAVPAVASGPAASAATGIAIYFPQSRELYDTEYDRLSSGGSWREMVKTYLDAGVSPGPGPDNPSGSSLPEFETNEATLQISSEGVVALARLTAESAPSVIDARLLGGILQPDGSVHHIVFGPAVIGAGDPRTIGGSWGFIYITLSDTQNTLESMVFIDAVPNALRLSIPLLYQSPTGDQVQTTLQLTLDASGNFVDQPHFITYRDDGSVSELNPAAGSLIAPLVFVSTPGGTSNLQLVSDIGLDPTSLSLNTALLPSGTTFHVALFATDSAGNSAIAVALGVVP